MAKFCSECGKSLEENIKFCPSCGTAVGETQTNNNEQLETIEQTQMESIEEQIVDKPEESDLIQSADDSAEQEEIQEETQEQDEAQELNEILTNDEPEEQSEAQVVPIQIEPAPEDNLRKRSKLPLVLSIVAVTIIGSIIAIILILNNRRTEETESATGGFSSINIPSVSNLPSSTQEDSTDGEDDIEDIDEADTIDETNESPAGISIPEIPTDSSNSSEEPSGLPIPSIPIIGDENEDETMSNETDNINNWLNIDGKIKIPPHWSYEFRAEEDMEWIFISSEEDYGFVDFVLGNIIDAPLADVLDECVYYEVFYFDNGKSGYMLVFEHTIAWVYADSWWEGLMLYNAGDMDMFYENESLFRTFAATMNI
ncbi:MAG: zinc-ribbon domain-containing protein [Oscillospiraceae bacterium]|nr:zinc-ribbon domain-containing protein [Oscillospiraceae bacterium]